MQYINELISTRMKRKGATPPNRAERVVRDLQSRMMPVHPSMPTHSSGTKHRRRRHSSNSSSEHIGNLMSSPNLHARLNKVREYQLNMSFNHWGPVVVIRHVFDWVNLGKCRNLCWTRYGETNTAPRFTTGTVSVVKYFLFLFLMGVCFVFFSFLNIEKKTTQKKAE